MRVTPFVQFFSNCAKVLGWHAFLCTILRIFEQLCHVFDFFCNFLHFFAHFLHVLLVQIFQYQSFVSAILQTFCNSALYVTVFGHPESHSFWSPLFITFWYFWCFFVLCYSMVLYCPFFIIIIFTFLNNILDCLILFVIFWYHMVFLVLFYTFWCLMVLYGNLETFMVLFGTLWC